MLRSERSRHGGDEHFFFSVQYIYSLSLSLSSFLSSLAFHVCIAQSSFLCNRTRARSLKSCSPLLFVEIEGRRTRG